MSAKWVERVRAKEKAWIEKGFCRKCGKPPKPGPRLVAKKKPSLCDSCAHSHRIHQQAYRWRKLLGAGLQMAA